MARRSQERIPYRLSALPSEQMICAIGDYSVTHELSRIDGAQKRPYTTGMYIAIPATRHAMMAVEAIAAPASTAPEYIELRKRVMGVPVKMLQEWREVAPQFRRPLMRHQEEFCALAYRRRGMFNASEQGTGKTATAIALSAAWGAKLTLVVTPKSIMRQWQGEYHSTLADPDDMVVVPLDGLSVIDRAEALALMMPMAPRLVAIINYDVITQLKQTILDVCAKYPVVLVLDESWRVKDRATKVTKATLEISKHCERVLCLTGTPVGQGVGDLWSQLCIIEGKEPPEMETYKQWIDAYERTIWTSSGQKSLGCKDAVGMMRRMEPWFYRATKTSCLDLPEKLPVQRVLLEMPESTKRLYRQVKEDGEAALGDGSSLMGAMATALRLQQIAGGFAFNPDGSYTEEEAGQPHDLRLRLIGSPKVEWLQDFCRDRLLGDPTHRVVVWCKFNSEVMHIRRLLERVLSGENRVVEVTGKTSDTDLEEWIASLNSKAEDGVQVMVAQIKKIAYGKNMQGVDTNVYYSHTWSHVEKSQSADRSHRFGRVGPVAYYELIAKGTIDQTIVQCTDNLQDMSDRFAPDTVGRGHIYE